MTRLTNRLFKETVLGLTAALVVCLAVGAGCSTKSREAEEFCQQGMEQLNQNEVDAAVDSFNKSLELDAKSRCENAISRPRRRNSIRLSNLTNRLSRRFADAANRTSVSANLNRRFPTLTKRLKSTLRKRRSAVIAVTLTRALAN